MKRLINFWSHHDLTLTVLGICPLLIVVTNVTTGISVGLLCLLTLVFTGTVISFLKNLIPYELRFLVTIVITSTVVSLVSLGMQFWFFPLSEVLGIYISLIAMNCLILAFAEEVFLRHSTFYSFLQSMRNGVGMMLIFIFVGIVREVLGFGTLLQQAELLFGDVARSWTIHFFDGSGIILIKQVPGVFLVLGLLMAGLNYLKGPLNNKLDQSVSS
jgi:electron transport complex protein RnfE